MVLPGVPYDPTPVEVDGERGGRGGGGGGDGRRRGERAAAARAKRGPGQSTLHKRCVSCTHAAKAAHKSLVRNPSFGAGGIRNAVTRHAIFFLQAIFFFVCDLEVSRFAKRHVASRSAWQRRDHLSRVTSRIGTSRLSMPALPLDCGPTAVVASWRCKH
eukprot:1215097-Rhodomonas_salina.2